MLSMAEPAESEQGMKVPSTASETQGRQLVAPVFPAQAANGLIPRAYE